MLEMQSFPLGQLDTYFVHYIYAHEMHYFAWATYFIHTPKYYLYKYPLNNTVIVKVCMDHNELKFNSTTLISHIAKV